MKFQRESTDNLIDNEEKEGKPSPLTEEQLVDPVVGSRQTASAVAMQYDISNIQTVVELQEAIVNIQDGQTIKLAPTFISGPMSVVIPDVAFTIDGNNVNWTEGKITPTGNGKEVVDDNQHSLEWFSEEMATSLKMVVARAR
ncbi:hypothetical protein MGH68_09885 [Erysipelothrix sp. D19-032]